MAADDPHRVNHLTDIEASCPVRGRVIWDAPHSIWNGAMTLGAVVLAPVFVSWSAVAIFFVLSGTLLLLGHSVGYHRRLIHGSFQCPLWVEHALVYAGVLVGMSGPFWMMRAHDLRDWAQRRPDCHPALRNGGTVWADYLACVHGRLVLERPPTFSPPRRVREDRFYRFLEKTWMLHQAPVAIALYALGGWPWVVWGVCVRVAASVTGHWWVGHLAHRRGPQTWLVDDAGVQAHDVPWAAIPTMGEAWHNNHHAWPGSAKMGLYPGQADWGWRFVQALEQLGLAWDVRTPETMSARPLTPAAGDAA